MMTSLAYSGFVAMFWLRFLQVNVSFLHISAVSVCLGVGSIHVSVSLRVLSVKMYWSGHYGKL